MGTVIQATVLEKQRTLFQNGDLWNKGGGSESREGGFKSGFNILWH